MGQEAGSENQDAHDEPSEAVPNAATPPQPVMLEYARHTPGRLRPVAHFATDFEAGLASGLLDSRGVQCVSIRKTDPWGRWSVDLQVSETDGPEAVHILAASPARKFLTVPPSELPTTPVLKALACPACGSTHLGPVRRTRVILIPLLLLAWLPLLGGLGTVIYIFLLLVWPALCILDRPWVCRECGKRLPPGGASPDDEDDEPRPQSRFDEKSNPEKKPDSMDEPD
jgi:hypothetical protein